MKKNISGTLFGLGALAAVTVGAAEAIVLQPFQVTRVAWGINWVDQCRRLGGDGNFDGGPQRLVLRFDLSELPDGFELERATLQLQSKDPLPWDGGQGDGVIELGVYPLLRNLPTIDKTALSAPGTLAAQPAATANWQFDWTRPGEVDLTALLREWLSGDRMNFGILLRATGDEDTAPDYDMFHLGTIELELTGSTPAGAPVTYSLPVATIPPAEGEAGWRFPDGSVCAAAALPGRLLSDNAGFWGAFQIPTGVQIRSNQEAEACRDGDFSTGFFLPGRSTEPALVWEFPTAVSLREIDLAARSGFGAFQVEWVVSSDAKQWRKLTEFRQRTDRQTFFRIGGFEPEPIRFLGLINRGAAPLELQEVLLWGAGQAVAATQPSGILSEMSAATDRELAVRHSDVVPNWDHFDPADLSGMTEVAFHPLLEPTATDPATRAGLLMHPAGLDLVFICRKNAAATLDQTEVYLNRYDLDERRYYSVQLDADGRQHADAGALIDPTKGGVPFVPLTRVREAGEFRYMFWRLPLAALAAEEGFAAHRWTLNLARRIAMDGREAISSFPAVPELHIPMRFAIVRSERHQTAAEYQSFSGLSDTGFSAAEFAAWQRQSGALAASEVIVAPAALESEVLTAPVLPIAGLNASRREQMTAEEIENLAWYVINPSATATRELMVRFSGFTPGSGIETELGVVGVVQRRRGAMLRPIFLTGNFPSAATLRTYVRNAAEIENFPTLRLPPGGAALVTLRVRTAQAAPGAHNGTMWFGTVALPVDLTVLPVTTLRPRDYFYTVWGSPTTSASPLAGSRYAENEARYWYDSGYNVVSAYPLTDSEGLRAMRATIPDLKYVFCFSPSYTHLGYTGALSGEDYSEKDRQQIIADARRCRDELLAAGFDYDSWCFELWDEPGVGVGTSLMAKIAETVKEFDSRIQLYCNPCCWIGDGFAADADILRAFEPWYNRWIDISMPIEGLYFGFGKRDMSALHTLWEAPRRYNGSYIHPCPGRSQLWRNFGAGFNALGYYSYSVPRANPWNDFDAGEMDYQTVYPGVTAPVITIESEQMREGFEDIRMWFTLQELGDRRPLEHWLQPAGWQERRAALLDALAAAEF